MTNGFQWPVKLTQTDRKEAKTTLQLKLVSDDDNNNNPIQSTKIEDSLQTAKIHYLVG